ncbi:TVP38/TMEM64 family protein [Shewanella chilikensis]|uniref:TVP38/TMEM64 family protein n=1 Tax=Shewanella chilikensis TaxID=558541 RepID=UPI001F2EEE37|nr:VTT domain-containing protein [Shewanella chilikensis]MCE9789067.1 VTT domain-containing protein [Shewanella chilikensis]
MKRLLKTLLLMSVLLGLMLAVQAGWFEHLTDSKWVANFIHRQGPTGLALLFAVGTLFTAVGGPRQIIAFAFGFALGGTVGALFSTFAALAGCLLSFYCARLTVHEFLQKRLGSRLQRFERLIIHRTWLKVLMIRLLPVGSNLLTNLFAGATRVSAGGFLIGSFIGYLPQMLIFAYAGAGLGLSDQYQLGISLVLLLLSSAIGTYLYRNRLSRQVDDLVTDKQGL